MNLHTGARPYCCAECGKRFCQIYNYRVHLRTHALVKVDRPHCHRNFKCTDCTKTFTKKNALLKHSFSHLGLLPYTCIRCRRHFRLAKLYRQHKCEPERIHCVACLREFLSQEDFQQHKKDTGCWGNQDRNVTPDEIRCLECGQRFDTSEELKKHAGAHQRVLKCAECGKGFRSRTHTGEKPYRCSQCGKCFTQSGALKIHTRIHTGERPFVCSICGKGFSNRSGIRFHYRTVHGLAPEHSREGGAGGVYRGPADRGCPPGRPRTLPPTTIGLNSPNSTDDDSNAAPDSGDNSELIASHPGSALFERKSQSEGYWNPSK
uniref:C2H2-type domain-containing protein n=1 Tax=Amphiprion ocellaris TaxID=80972 RepID=A0AAQ5YLJ9_AMPOC